VLQANFLHLPGKGGFRDELLESACPASDRSLSATTVIGGTDEEHRKEGRETAAILINCLFTGQH
jgi:hypothetical protein